MIYIKIANGLPVEISDKTQHHKDWVSRWDWKSFDEVQFICNNLSMITNKKYIPIDEGRNVTPRFDIVEAPQIGDKVSKYFNGDSYPCGEIKSISSTGRKIVTSTGHSFNRKKLSGSWINKGTWSMISGHHNDRNPEF